MKNLYKKTFDKVSMPEEAYLHLRTVLASECSQRKTEVKIMKNRTCFKRGIIIALAVLMLAAMSITAFAYGGDVIYKIWPALDPDLPESADITEITDMEPVEIMPYEYTEEDGSIIVTFDERN